MAEGAGLDQHRIGKRNDPLDVDSKTIVVLKNPRDDTLEDRLRPHECLAQPFSHQGTPTRPC